MTQPDEFVPEEHLAPDERDFEVPDADAIEQAQVVDLDDEYR